MKRHATGILENQNQLWIQRQFKFTSLFSKIFLFVWFLILPQAMNLRCQSKEWANPASSLVQFYAFTLLSLNTVSWTKGRILLWGLAQAQTWKLSVWNLAEAKQNLQVWARQKLGLKAQVPAQNIKKSL